MNADIRALVWKYLEGECSEAEREELSRSVNQDEGALRYLVRAAEETMELVKYCRHVTTEQAAVARPSRSWNWRPAAVLAAAGLLIAVCAHFFLIGSPGGVRLAAGSGRTIAASYEGSTVQLRLEESTTLILEGAKVVRQAKKVARSDEIILRGAERKVARLESGTVAISMAKCNGAESLALRTRHAEIRVTGTRCAVCAGSLGTRLDMLEGTAVFKAYVDGRAHTVSAGEYAAVEDGDGASRIGRREVLLKEGILKKSIPLDARIKEPAGIAFDGRALWISEAAEPVLYRVAPANGSVLGEYRLGISSRIRSLVWDGERLWALPADGSNLLALRTTDCTIAETRAMREGWSQFAFGARHFWVAKEKTRQIGHETVLRLVEKVDAGGRVTGTLEYAVQPFTLARGVLPCAYLGGHLWIRFESRVFPIRTMDGSVVGRCVMPLASRNWNSGIAPALSEDSDSLWALDRADDSSGYVARLVKVMGTL